MSAKIISLKGETIQDKAITVRDALLNINSLMLENIGESTKVSDCFLIFRLANGQISYCEQTLAPGDTLETLGMLEVIKYLLHVTMLNIK